MNKAKSPDARLGSREGRKGEIQAGSRIFQHHAFCGKLMAERLCRQRIILITPLFEASGREYKYRLSLRSVVNRPTVLLD